MYRRPASPRSSSLCRWKPRCLHLTLRLARTIVVRTSIEYMLYHRELTCCARLLPSWQGEGCPAHLRRKGAREGSCQGTGREGEFRKRAGRRRSDAEHLASRRCSAWIQGGMPRLLLGGLVPRISMAVRVVNTWCSRAERSNLQC